VPLQLVVLDEHPCVYLPDRVARSRGFLAPVRMSGQLYHRFMDAGFRRSGRLIYQPVCAACRACVPIRVPTEEFRPSKSQRRCRRRNLDLVVEVGAPRATGEKFDLYQRYLTGRHDRLMDDDRESMESFLYDSPIDTLEFTYRDSAGKLLAVGICDVCPRSLSSIYFFFDPEHRRRGLGTFGALVEIAFAAQHEIPHYYLGYWVSGARTMEYKTSFRPYELLGPDGLWHRAATIDGESRCD
jgi:arginine-tRNA-protein transferase